MADLMTPDEFGDVLDRLIAGMKTIVTLPLDEMTKYVDRVETLGAEVGMTTEQATTTAYAARLIAAAHHLQQTAVMGGA